MFGEGRNTVQTWNQNRSCRQKLGVLQPHAT